MFYGLSHRHRLHRGCNGRPLPAAEFEHWSEVMARNYREPLRSWFMSEGRYIREGYFALSGAELIRMGYPRC